MHAVDSYFDYDRAIVEAPRETVNDICLMIQSLQLLRKSSTLACIAVDSDFDYDRAGVEVLREAVKDLQLQLKASQDSLRVQQQASLNEVAELKMQHRNKVSHFQTLIAERDLRVSQLEADVATQKKKVRHAKKKAEALKKANGVKDGGEEDVVEKEEKATTPSLCTDVRSFYWIFALYKIVFFCLFCFFFFLQKHWYQSG